MSHKVCMVGSGNFACSIARNVGQNVERYPEMFQQEIVMWVHEETVKDDEGKDQKLSDVINEKHENVKYLPGKTLPAIVRAEPDLAKACQGCDILIFCLPHQFILKACDSIKGNIDVSKAQGVSLVKGFHSENLNFRLVSELIEESLGIKCNCMMGANLADEISEDLFAESTIGCADEEEAVILKKLFETKHFRVQTTPDVKTVEMCGALKNIVAVASGMIEGMKLGNNARAAIIRIGLKEMKRFIRHFNPDYQVNTIFESCGVADLITTCTGGRNSFIGKIYAENCGEKSFPDLEKEHLNGQKLQGHLTANEVHHKLKQESLEDKFPLFVIVAEICDGKAKPTDMIKIFEETDY